MEKDLTEEVNRTSVTRRALQHTEDYFLKSAALMVDGPNIPFSWVAGFAMVPLTPVAFPVYFVREAYRDYRERK